MIKRREFITLVGGVAEVQVEPPLPTTDGGRIAALKLNSGLLQIDRLVAAVLVELSAPYLV